MCLFFFFYWFLSLSVMFSELINTVTCQYFTSFCGWKICHICLSIYQLMGIGIFPFFWMNNDIINIHMNVFVWSYVVPFLGYMTRSRIVSSCGNTMFNTLKFCQTIPKWLHHFIFISTSNIGIPILHTLPNTCVFVFSILAILVGMKW